MIEEPRVQEPLAGLDGNVYQNYLEVLNGVYCFHCNHIDIFKRVVTLGSPSLPDGDEGDSGDDGGDPYGDKR